MVRILALFGILTAGLSAQLRPPLWVSLEAGWGIGGTVRNTDILLPTYSRGPTARMDLSVLIRKSVTNQFYAYFAPGFVGTAYYLTFFHTDYSTFGFQLPLGGEYIINTNHSLLLGMIGTWEARGSLNVVHRVGDSGTNITIPESDLGRGILGGTFGWHYREAWGGYMLLLQAYRSAFLGTYLGLRFSIHFDIYTAKWSNDAI